MSKTQPRHPDYDGAAEDPTVDGLLGAYRAVADLFVYPEEVDQEALSKRCRTAVIPAVRRDVDEEAADHLEAFVDSYDDIDADEYVHTHELDPTCPLYVGHYEFDEPETCRDISDADRNQYMVELNAIYEHFGFELADELPDFVPAMVEFCWLTMPERDDGLRDEFMEKFVKLLPDMRKQFEQTGTPYWRLLAALERLIEVDLTLSEETTADVSEAGPAADSVAGGENR